MTEPDVTAVRITIREVYDLVIRIDQKLSALDQARHFETEQRNMLIQRIEEVEASLRQVQLRMAAWPAVATVAAIVAILIGVNNLLKG